jgi:hypothetical protein
MATIASKRRAVPAYFLQMNFKVPGSGLVHIFETNPNKLPKGQRMLQQLLCTIFGENAVNRLKISRLDLNADIEVPVDWLRRAIRIPRKRKTTSFGSDGIVGDYTNRGLTGFYIGRSPSLLRVYDKREEMKTLRRDVSGLPPILTRVEWELRQRRCPIHRLNELSSLLEQRPFDPLQIIETDDVYDFHNAPGDSTKRFLLKELSQQYGCHDAIRILNACGRNYSRDYKNIAVNTSEIKERLHASYLDGLHRFFRNEPADVDSAYPFTDPNSATAMEYS